LWIKTEMESGDTLNPAESVHKKPGNDMKGFLSGNTLLEAVRDPASLVAPLVVASVVASLVSVAVSGIFLGFGFVAWIADCMRKRRVFISSPPFKWYLLVFLLFSVLSAIFSDEPLSDIRHLKSYIKFIIPFLLIAYMTMSQAKKSLLWVFLVSGASMIWGFVQFFLMDGVDLLHRIDGFMSHWMTYSGQIMMVLIACTSYGIFILKSRKGKQRFKCFPWFFLSSLMAVNLIFTYTRSAWLGALGGLIVLAALNLRKRWVLILGAAAIMAFILMPSTVHQRLRSGFDPTDTTTRGRLDIWRSGITVALKHPVAGVGFSSAQRESLKYRREMDFADWAYQHSHNNLIQLAATSGFPALAAWLALWLRIIWDYYKILSQNRRNEFSTVLATAGISILTAFHLMGLMEFNFGDSEVLTLLLFFISIPYVASGRSAAAKASSAF
jgi:O-antigen ligase